MTLLKWLKATLTIAPAAELRLVNSDLERDVTIPADIYDGLQRFGAARKARLAPSFESALELHAQPFADLRNARAPWRAIVALCAECGVLPANYDPNLLSAQYNRVMRKRRAVAEASPQPSAAPLARVTPSPPAPRTNRPEVPPSAPRPEQSEVASSLRGGQARGAKGLLLPDVDEDLAASLRALRDG